jgi:large subunit ribosomal protein L15
VVGRGHGSGKGTTAGRGGKGQTARTGGRNKLKLLGMRHIILATPKLRGARMSAGPKPKLVDLAGLDAAFKSGDEVTPKSLAAKGLVPSGAGRIKILADGSLKKKLMVSGCAVSASAKEKILAAGGEIR